MNHKLPEEANFPNFQCLLREEAIELYQSLTITTETNLNGVLTKSSKESEKDNLKEVAPYKWDQAKYDPSVGTFSD